MKAFFSDAVTNITNRVTANRIVNKATASDKLELDDEEATEVAVFANTVSAALVVSNLKSRLESKTPAAQFLSMRLVSFLIDNCNSQMHEELAKDTELHARLIQLASTLQEVEPGAARSAVRVRMEARRVILDMSRTFQGVGSSTAPLSAMKTSYERVTRKRLERAVLMEGKRIRFRAVNDDDILLISPRNAFGSRRAMVAAKQVKEERMLLEQQQQQQQTLLQVGGAAAAASSGEPKSPSTIGSFISGERAEAGAAAAAAAEAERKSSPQQRAAFSDPANGVIFEGAVLPPLSDPATGQHAGSTIHHGRVSSPPLPKKALSDGIMNDANDDCFASPVVVAGVIVSSSSSSSCSVARSPIEVTLSLGDPSSAAKPTFAAALTKPEGKRRKAMGNGDDDAEEGQALLEQQQKQQEQQKEKHVPSTELTSRNDVDESAPLPPMAFSPGNNNNKEEIVTAAADREPVSAFQQQDEDDAAASLADNSSAPVVVSGAAEEDAAGVADGGDDDSGQEESSAAAAADQQPGGGKKGQQKKKKGGRK